MPKTKDDGFLLDDSELDPYTVDEPDLEEDPSYESKNPQDDKLK